MKFNCHLKIILEQELQQTVDRLLESESSASLISRLPDNVCDLRSMWQRLRAFLASMMMLCLRNAGELIVRSTHLCRSGQAGSLG